MQLPAKIPGGTHPSPPASPHTSSDCDNYDPCHVSLPAPLLACTDARFTSLRESHLEHRRWERPSWPQRWLGGCSRSARTAGEETRAPPLSPPCVARVFGARWTQADRPTTATDTRARAPVSFLCILFPLLFSLSSFPGIKLAPRARLTFFGRRPQPSPLSRLNRASSAGPLMRPASETADWLVNFQRVDQACNECSLRADADALSSREPRPVCACGTSEPRRQAAQTVVPRNTSAPRGEDVSLFPRGWRAHSAHRSGRRRVAPI